MDDMDDTDNLWTITWEGSPYKLTASRVVMPSPGKKPRVVQIEGLKGLPHTFSRLLSDVKRSGGARITFHQEAVTSGYSGSELCCKPFRVEGLSLRPEDDLAIMVELTVAD